MWHTWANLSQAKIEILKTNTIYNTSHLLEAQKIPNDFPLSMFNHQKCSTPLVKIHTK